MTDVFQYAIQNGVVEDELYPYEFAESWTGCESKRRKLSINVTGYVELTSETEKELELAVMTVGPIAVGIDASRVSMQFYEYGVYSDLKCNASNANHAVLGEI